MPSKTSFFNKGIFGNNIKRFWLIGLAFTILLMLFVFSILNNISTRVDNVYENYTPNQGAYEILSQSGTLMTILLGFFSIIAAIAVFSYMHFQKNTTMIHSLPVRRESLFITNYISGLALLMLPILINSAILFIGGLMIGITDFSPLLTWILISVCSGFLLYSFAVFAGMFTGHMAAHAVFFLVFNLLAIFLETVINQVFSSFLFGYVPNSNDMINALSPLSYIRHIYLGFANSIPNYGVLTVYFIAGIVFSCIAYRMYIKRNMESAGDVISLKLIKPVFKYTVAICSAALTGMIIIDLFSLKESLAGYVISYLTGGFIGYFASEMLLRKTFRVFRQLKGFLIFALAIVLVLTGINLDLFGYETSVPKAEEVEVMYLGSSINNIGILALSPEKYDYTRDQYIFNNPPKHLSDKDIKELRKSAGVLENQETIKKAVEFHSYIAKNIRQIENTNNDYYIQRAINADYSDMRFINLNVAYRLKGGRIVRRYYNLPYSPDKEKELDSRLSELLLTPEIMEKSVPALNIKADELNYIAVSFHNKEESYYTKSLTENLDGLLDAYKQDILESDPINLLIYSNTKNSLPIEITLNLREAESLTGLFNGNIYRIPDTKTLTFRLSEDHNHTIEYLIQNGIITKDII